MTAAWLLLSLAPDRRCASSCGPDGATSRQREVRSQSAAGRPEHHPGMFVERGCRRRPPRQAGRRRKRLLMPLVFFVRGVGRARWDGGSRRTRSVSCSVLLCRIQHAVLALFIHEILIITLVRFDDLIERLT